MSAKSKYQEVLDLGEEFGIQDGYVNEEKRQTQNRWCCQYSIEKDRLWDKIKQIGGENPADIEADIKVGDTSVYHRHVVQSGDTLGKIAKMYYGKPGEYMKIFNANTDKLKDPNLIYPDQSW